MLSRLTYLTTLSLLLLPALLAAQPMTDDELFAELEFADLHFQDTVVSEEQYFQQVEILGRSVIHRSQVDRLMTFLDTRFSEGADWYSSRLATVDFYNVKFDGGVYWQECRFSGAVSCDDCATLHNGEETTWKNYFSCYSDTFEVDLTMKGNDFYGEVLFENCVFSRTEIKGGTHHQTTKISGGHLGSYFSVSNQHLNEGMLIANCTLPDTLRLSKLSTEEGGIKITRCVLDAEKLAANPEYKCILVLDDMDPNLLDFEHKYFELYIDPKERFELNVSKYDGLLARFQALGYVSSYEEMDREFKEFVYLHEDMENPKVLMNMLDEWWWGYGYDRHLIVTNTLMVLLFFVLLNGLFLRSFLEKVYNVNDIADGKVFQEKWRTLNPVVRYFYFLPTTLFATSLIFFGLKFDPDKLVSGDSLGWKRVPRIAYFLVIYLSGLFCIAYLVNFVLNQ